MSNPTKIQCNGPRVQQLRVRQSMTQEKLAAMSNVNHRTVQRAERGEVLQLDTLASLAAALGVTVGELTLPDDSAEQIDRDESSESNAVVLRRMTSGIALIELICDSFSGKLYCGAEPTEDNIATLTDMVERIERLIPNPWASPFEAENLTLAQRLREALAITSQLTELERLGIAVFAGTYTARAQVPHYDPDEGHVMTWRGQKFEPVTVCRISINPVGVDRVTVKVSDEWQDQASPAPSPLPSDDEIPF
jgi:transcriptional regulator with XRE-family HTH domain